MKKMFAVLLMLALTLCAAGAMARTYTDAQDVQYYYDTLGNTATVYHCPRWATSVTIPETITGVDKTYEVTVIMSDAFKNHKALTSVTIPSSVTIIGSRAFEGCIDLTSVTFSGANPPTFAADLFLNTDLQTIRVPHDSVELYKTALKDAKIFPNNENSTCDALVVCAEHNPNPPKPEPQPEPQQPAASADLPRTGDSSSLALWLALLGLAGAGMMMRRREA